MGDQAGIVGAALLGASKALDQLWLANESSLV